MSMRTRSQAITLRDISDLRCLSEPPKDRQNPSPHPDPIATGSKGKGRVFLTEVIDEGPSGRNPEGEPNDPGNNVLPQEPSDHGDPEDLNDLTDDALMRRVFVSFAKPCQPDTRAKVKELDAYDGSNQAKLRMFFLQCMLNFRDCPSAFKTGSAKVQYAISYLTGTALQYCEPAILSEIQPESPWLGDWDLFKAELNSTLVLSTTQPKPRLSSKKSS
jgi:hypothetical protein